MHRMVRAEITSVKQYRSASFFIDSCGEMRVELGGGLAVRIGWSQFDDCVTGELDTELWSLDLSRGKGRTLLRPGDDMGLLISCTGGVMVAKLRLREALRAGTLAIGRTDD